MRYVCTLALCLVLVGCQEKNMPVSFKSDVDFLKANVETIVLTDPAQQAQVALVPAYQGRVMTSTAAGNDGISFGWINRKAIASKKIEPHINVYGGEDRFWLGPEGGPFTIFFAKGQQQNGENWQTPAVIDTEPFQVISKTTDKATFGRLMQVKNASGTVFDLKVTRTVELVDRTRAAQYFNVEIPVDVKAVAYQSQNVITNTGKQPWKKETGLLSIWILGMYNPSPRTTVVVPLKAPDVADAYFGKVPADRLKIEQIQPSTSIPGFVAFFSADGQYRSKIGVPPKAAKPILGSYDAANKVLTLVQYNAPANMTQVSYVNSQWGDQKDPFAGDVVNSYNDGPMAPGKPPMGPFYELETSSPGAELAPNGSLTHIHRTVHIQGDEKALDAIARQTLGVGLETITTALKK